MIDGGMEFAGFLCMGGSKEREVGVGVGVGIGIITSCSSRKNDKGGKQSMSGANIYNPEEYTTGGLLDDANVTILEADYCMFDYQGKAASPVPALHIKMKDEDGEEHDQYWSCGNADSFRPTEDGTGLDPIGRRSTLVKTANAALFFTWLFGKADFPMDKISDDERGIGVLVGMECHVVRVKGNTKMKRKDSRGEDQDLEVLVIDEISTFPWDATSAAKGKAKAAAKGKAATKTATKTATKAAATGVDPEEVQGIIMEVLAEKGGTEKKAQLLPAVFKKIQGRKDVQAILGMLNNDEFLTSGPWSYENGVLTLG